MANSKLVLILLLVTAAVFGVAGCSSGAGTGGQPGAGGRSGGNTASGEAGGTASSAGGSTASGAAGASKGAGGAVTATGGTGASGGAIGTGGTTPAGGSGGGISAGGATGASTGAGGVVGGGCPGVPITPDANGFVSPASNTVGIHGSWFVYSDCNDLHGKNCATVTSPTGIGFANTGGKLCTSGMTSSAAGAWGAGIGLELNDGPPQMPYDTTAHGVKGFCFVLSGATIPSTSIRVAFPTQDNNDNAYFQPISAPGQHTVLFSDTAQGSWVTQKSAWQPTKVMLLQLQIPSAPAAPVPWDFCIEGLTAITD